MADRRHQSSRHRNCFPMTMHTVIQYLGQYLAIKSSKYGFKRERENIKNIKNVYINSCILFYI